MGGCWFIACGRAAFADYQGGFWAGEQTTARPRLADSGDIDYTMVCTVYLFVFCTN